MIITVDVAMYPLDANFKPSIIEFIRDLGAYGDIEIVTNQLSTQLRGEFGDVTTALNECMARHMSRGAKVVYVARYLNSDLDISRPPDLD